MWIGTLTLRLTSGDETHVVIARSEYLLSHAMIASLEEKHPQMTQQQIGKKLDRLHIQQLKPIRGTSGDCYRMTWPIKHREG